LSDTTRPKQLSVVLPSGVRQRFLRGMVTHDLVQRGLDFDSSYSIAQAIRDHLGNREEVTTSELRDMIQEELSRIYGEDLSPSMLDPIKPIPEIIIINRDQEQPFSRGLLARSIEAGGVSLDRAYRLVAELEAQLRGERLMRLPSGEVVRRVAELLERLESQSIANRYRLMRRIRNLSRPLIVYVGGATGTGKSTLALELAPLLRIHRVSATDTIRQVMRMVFTPSILPALHSSTFEATDPRAMDATGSATGSPKDPEFAQRLVDTFEEQATRVCVGVRAVVERAVTENTSLLVEGVHIHPGLVPFRDFEGLAYQVPLFLATLNEETHRARFLSRARHSNRMAERYLENFDSIRFMHDHLLQQIESNEQPLLDTSSVDASDGQALRTITGILEREAPFLASPDLDMYSTSPVLLVIIDGLADRATGVLGDRTPLQAAATPTFDRLAREGQCGLADVVGPGGIADTVAGTLALFGQSPLSLHRGPAEAIGAGMVLNPEDVALRGNFATIDETGMVLDRRAGRIRDGIEDLADAIDGLVLPGRFGERITVNVKPASEHRLAVVIRGEGLSAAIHGSDPDELGTLVLTPQALDSGDESALHTANTLDLFEQEARKILANHPVNRDRTDHGLVPANAVITRGAGRLHRLLPLEQEGVPLRFTCIGRDRAVLGLGRMLGASTVTTAGMTANLDTDLAAKFTAAESALEDNDLVALHIKGADIAGHDCHPELKSQFLGQIDKALAKLVKEYDGPLRIAIAADHATLSESGEHAADPVPVLMWGDGISADNVQAYDEQSVSKGDLKRFPLQHLLANLFHLS
jgi:2,3-bisphosphoglycerate-independent phosphoglycerate mutase